MRSTYRYASAYRAPTVAFRLMTANLLQERLALGQFAELLDREAPDVVVFQELAGPAAKLVAERFPNHWLRPAFRYTGRGIATRFPVVFGDVSMPGRNGTFAELETPDGVVRLVGVHLHNPIDFPWWVSVRSRGAQLDGLFDWVKLHDPPMVVAGDFNASPAWPAYKRVAAHFEDLVLAADPDPAPTWAWRPRWPRMLRIDHVFGVGVQSTRVEVIPVDGSDHAAIVIDLVVPGSA